MEYVRFICWSKIAFIPRTHTHTHTNTAHFVTTNISTYWRKINIVTMYVKSLCGSATLLGAFQKVTKLVVSSSCLSVHSHGATGSKYSNLMKFEVWIFFEKLSKNFKIYLKSDENSEHFTWRPMCAYDNILLSFSWNKKCFRQN